MYKWQESRRQPEGQAQESSRAGDKLVQSIMKLINDNTTLESSTLYAHL